MKKLHWMFADAVMLALDAVEHGEITRAQINEYTDAIWADMEKQNEEADAETETA